MIPIVGDEAMDDPEGGAVMIGRFVGRMTGRGGRRGQVRSAALDGPSGVAVETMHGVRPLLATVAATATAMLTTILWV